MKGQSPSFAKAVNTNCTRNENVAITLYMITILIWNGSNTVPHAATQTISVCS